MAVVPVIKTPDPILDKKCAKVAAISADDTKIIKDLLDTVRHPNSAAAGLSAPQIGYSKRICVVRKFTPDPNDKNNELSKEFVFVNPEIIEKSEDMQAGWEGCLSIPDTYGVVERNSKIKIKAQDEHGKEVTLKATGFFGRVIQHEIDHLNGILFTSKVIGRTLSEKELDEYYVKA